MAHPENSDLLNAVVQLLTERGSDGSVVLTLAAHQNAVVGILARPAR